MIASDILLLGALALFLFAWCWPRLPRRRVLLWLGTSVVVVSAGYGVLVDRWQAGGGLLLGLLWLVVLFFSGRRQGWRRSGVPYLSALGFVMLAVVAVAPIYLFPVDRLPTPTGSQAVGVRDFELVDAQRRGVLGAPADAPRRLLVRVWYPAKPAAGAESRPYFTAAEASSTARGFGTLLGFPPLLSHLRHITSNAYEDAPVATSDGKLPVVFFSHGYASYTAANSALMEDLASHGYAVYSVQHSGDASPTLLPDGDVVPMDPGLAEHMRHVFSAGLPEAMVRGYSSADLDERLDGQLRTALEIPPPANRGISVSAPVWLADRLFVHDRLQAGAVPASVTDLVAASDFTRTGEMGMSFGGSTAGAVCMVDSRCAAAINLDGGDFHFLAFGAELPVPLLMFHADLDGFYRMLGVEPQGPLYGFNDFSYERFEQAGTRSDIYRPVMKGSVHAGFTDNGLLLRGPLRDALAGTAPNEVLIGAANAFVLGFLDHHLRGLDNGFPQAQYRQYADWIAPHDTSAVRRWWLAKPQSEREVIEQRLQVLPRVEHRPAR